MAVVLMMVNIRIILVIKNLEKEMGKHSSILAWRTPYTEKAGCSPCDHKESDMTERLNNSNQKVNWQTEAIMSDH